MDNNPKPEGYFDPKDDPEERANERKFQRMPAPPGTVPEVEAVEAAPVDEAYFTPKTAEDHRKNCVAVMRRGKQQRLIFAIAKLEMIEDKYDSELETLAHCRKELKTLETAMRRSGQEP